MGALPVPELLKCVLPDFDLFAAWLNCSSILRADDLITVKCVETVPDTKIIREDTFKIQRALLLNASPWFTPALDKASNEEQVRTLTFTETPIRVLHYFVCWLLNGKLLIEEFTDDLEKSDRELLAVRLWIFGDKHLLPVIKNIAIRTIFWQVTGKNPEVQTIMEALHGSPTGSPLRKLMMRTLVANWMVVTEEGDSEPGYMTEDLGRYGAIAGFTEDFAREMENLIQGMRMMSRQPDKAETYLVSEGGPRGCKRFYEE